MKPLHAAVVLVSSFASLEPSVAFASDTCPLEKVTSARELQSVLSKQAVEIVRLAGNSHTNPDRLSMLVSSSAAFSTGGGDVVVPLGTGIEGARALAKDLSADSFRYLGWDYMDMPADPCSLHVVTVEFVNSGSKTVSSIEFSFDAGRLVKAKGWTRSFETGVLKAPDARHK
jgi:hypothetical protein